jgi:hypothetical protein
VSGFRFRSGGLASRSRFFFVVVSCGGFRGRGTTGSAPRGLRGFVLIIVILGLVVVVVRTRRRVRRGSDMTIERLCHLHVKVPEVGFLILRTLIDWTRAATKEGMHHNSPDTTRRACSEGNTSFPDNRSSVDGDFDFSITFTEVVESHSFSESRPLSR